MLARERVQLLCKDSGWQCTFERPIQDLKHTREIGSSFCEGKIIFCHPQSADKPCIAVHFIRGSNVVVTFKTADAPDVGFESQRFLDGTHRVDNHRIVSRKAVEIEYPEERSIYGGVGFVVNIVLKVQTPEKAAFRVAV